MIATGSHPYLMAAAHFGLFASQAALFGLLPVALLVLRPAFLLLPARHGDVRVATALRLERVVDAALILAALATLAVLVLQAALVAGVQGTAVTSGVASGVLDSNIGRWCVLRLVLLVALVVVLHGRVRTHVLERSGKPLWWWSWGGLSLTLLATVSLSGHARSAGHVVIVVAADVVHLASGAIWLTGVAVIALVLPGPIARLRQGDREQLFSAVVLAFSSVALVAIPVVTVTGVLNGLADIGQLADLGHTDYGQAFVVKLWLFAWVLAFGGYNHYWLRRRLAGRSGAAAAARARGALAQTVTGELVFGLLMVAATALLVGLPKTG